MKISNFLKLVVAIGVSELAGVIGSVFTISSIPNWYAGLVKPALSPPNWVFGPVWTILYFLMGVAAFFVWQKGFEKKEVKMALGIFILQLFLNIIWSIIFFGLKNPGWAFVEIIILWFAILWTMIVFYKISRVAVFLLLPYIIWVSFAAYLNYSIWQLQAKVSNPVVSINSFEECVSAGYSVLEIYPAQCKTPDGKIFTQDIGNELVKIDLIKIDHPRPNQSIESPLLVKGEARGTWFFEASFPVKLFDDNGFLLAAVPAQALSDWMTEDFVPFSVSFPFAVPSTTKGKLILEKDNPSGLQEQDDELIVPVYFKDAPENQKDFQTVKIFFSASSFAGEPSFDCSRTVAVERKVPKNPAIAKATVEALLRGVTREENDEGFISAINTGVRINSLIIESKTAKIDFDPQLEFQVGGSCKVAAIRSQITDTLKQFPTVENVIISINGRTEDILQP